MPDEPILAIIPSSGESRLRHFRFTMWELQDLVTALPLALDSERLDEPERERVRELQQKLVDLLRYAVGFNMDAVIEFRSSTEIQ